MDKKAPQIGGATLITMDRQGKCTGSEKLVALLPWSESQTNCKHNNTTSQP